jgi:hypothetical protein
MKMYKFTLNIQLFLYLFKILSFYEYLHVYMKILVDIIQKAIIFDLFYARFVIW